MPKLTAVEFPETVRAVASGEDSLAATILNRSKPLTREIVEAVMRRSVFTWQGRTPQPGYDAEGTIIHAGDLDFASFFVELAIRRAVIEIRDYQNRRPLVLKAGMHKHGDVSFGQIKRLVSHQEALSFSIHIRDQSIGMERSGTEELGYPMNFMVVDIDGSWYDGCSTIHFRPNAEENEFLKRYNLLVDDAIRFKYFVHPKRWQAIYGAPYLLLHLLIERMNDESSFYRKDLKRLKGLGVLPDKPESEAYESVGDTQRVRIRSFETSLEGVVLSGSTDGYALPRGDTKTRAQVAYDRQRLITYTWKPMAQFVRRADELAYFKYGLAKDLRPAWAANLPIVQKTSRGQTWSRMPLPGDLTLAFRAFELDQDVAA